MGTAHASDEPGARYADLCETLVNEPRRWLVTGCAGFIGSALIERLLDLGQEVVGVDNFASGHRRNLDSVLAYHPDTQLQFKFLEGDITDPALCRQAVTDVDVVLHQAAIGSVPRSIADPGPYHASNVTGFVNLLLAARDAGLKRFVYASSSSVYGDHQGLPKTEDVIGRPLSPYAATKVIDEIYADTFGRVYGLEVIGLRYFNVFGRRQDPAGLYAAVVPRWINNLLADRPCAIFGDGSASRDFCYVDNAVQANLLAGCAGPEAAGTVYNVACGARTTLLELFAILRDNLARYRPSAANAAPIFEPPRAGDIPHSLAAIDRIAAALGYAPTHDIHAGMAETVGWFVDHPQFLVR
ncbi:MAG TPA: SDR family oxidoreductase [Kofleriaceae bacterium]|nr:SDR family oxidoreductase [Kofleriaceae bacterium]